MGCDIHPYLEYYKEGSNYINGFGRVQTGGRNYLLFSILAGVRGGPALYPQRGVPDNLAYRTAGDWWYYIVDKEEDICEQNQCSKEKAARWVEEGASVYNDDKTRVSDPDAHSASWLNADELEKCYKEYSVLAAEEHSSIIAVYENMYKEHPELRKSERRTPIESLQDYTAIPELEMVLAAMRTAEKHGLTARLVFWFDN